MSGVWGDRGLWGWVVVGSVQTSSRIEACVAPVWRCYHFRDPPLPSRVPGHGPAKWRKDTSAWFGQTQRRQSVRSSERERVLNERLTTCAAHRLGIRCAAPRLTSGLISDPGEQCKRRRATLRSHCTGSFTQRSQVLHAPPRISTTWGWCVWSRCASKGRQIFFCRARTRSPTRRPTSSKFSA